MDISLGVVLWACLGWSCTYFNFLFLLQSGQQLSGTCWSPWGRRVGIDMEQRKSVYKLLYFCLQLSLLFLQSSWFAIWTVLSGNAVFLSLPSDTFTWNLFHLSMNGIFIWVFLAILTFLPKSSVFISTILIQDWQGSDSLLFYDLSQLWFVSIFLLCWSQ